MGTGVIIDRRGYIITNLHVVEDVGRIEVTLSDGSTAIAKLLNYDPSTDLALIKIPAVKELPTIQFGTSSDLMRGETVVAMAGAPLLLEPNGWFAVVLPRAMPASGEVGGFDVFTACAWHPSVNLLVLAKQATEPLLLAAHPALPVQTLAEFLALGRARAAAGRPLTYASGGNGASTHYAGVLFQNLAGFEVLHVPFRGGGPAVQALLAGNTVLIKPSEVTPFSGQLVADLFAEAGLPDGVLQDLAATLKLTDIRTSYPVKEEVKAVDPKGVLNKTDPDACCEVRKVRPLGPALEGFDAWITGRKRFHGGGRVRLPVVEFSEGRYKINPLIEWVPEDIETYFVNRALPRHPLVAEGYPSIGCWPCTVRPIDPTDVRSGRWVGFKKEECGLHLERQDRPRVF
jgi:hypothetical protein